MATYQANTIAEMKAIIGMTNGNDALGAWYDIRCDTQFRKADSERIILWLLTK